MGFIGYAVYVELEDIEGGRVGFLIRGLDYCWGAAYGTFEISISSREGSVWGARLMDPLLTTTALYTITSNQPEADRAKVLSWSWVCLYVS